MIQEGAGRNLFMRDLMTWSAIFCFEEHRQEPTEFLEQLLDNPLADTKSENL